MRGSLESFSEGHHNPTVTPPLPIPAHPITLPDRTPPRLSTARPPPESYFMRKILSTWSRKLHRWGAVAVVIPAVIVFITGAILQLKKDWTWVQPATIRGSGIEPTISFDEILAAATTAEEAGITTWEDVELLDVRTDRGVVKVRGKNRWEVQVDTNTGEILQVEFRRSDFIEAIHDGSFFSENYGKYAFLVNGLVLTSLWLTGIYLWLLPYIMKRSRAKKAAARAKT